MKTETGRRFITKQLTRLRFEKSKAEDARDEAQQHLDEVLTRIDSIGASIAELESELGA